MCGGDAALLSNYFDHLLRLKVHGKRWAAGFAVIFSVLPGRRLWTLLWAVTGHLADATGDFACLVMAALCNRAGDYIFAL